MVDDYVHVAQLPSTAQDVACDNAGNVFVYGSVRSVRSSEESMVRRSADGGQTWTIAAMWSGAYEQRAIVSSSNALFVAETIGGADGGAAVRRSLDGGITWTLVDTFRLSSDHGSQCRDVSADGSGHVYALGFGSTGPGTLDRGWFLRESADNGDSWSTATTVVDGSSGRAVVADGQGRVVVVGRLAGGHSWYVWGSNDSGTNWTVSDNFMGSASAHAAAADAMGNIFVVGGSDTYHWIVRKLPGTPSPKVQVTRGLSAIRLSWPTNLTGYVLESSATLEGDGQWESVQESPSVWGEDNLIIVDPDQPSAFFRLRRQ